MLTLPQLVIYSLLLFHHLSPASSSTSVIKDYKETSDEDEIFEQEYDDEDYEEFSPTHHKNEDDPEETSSGFDECSTYCYSNSNKCCGYTSSHWGSLCRQGKYQSPINLPACLVKSSLPNKVIYLDGDLYKGRFTIENDGHTVITRFLDKNKTIELSGVGFYVLDSVRFRWGKDEFSGGAEHCVKRPTSSGQEEPCQRESMEVQFIHYRADKGDIKSAIASNHKDAIVVISMFIRAVSSSQDTDITGPGLVPVLNPLVKQLELIAEAGTSVTVKSTLDFTPWIGHPNVASSYHGSLSSPQCKQVVKWVVLHAPMPVKVADLMAFRVIKDGGGRGVKRNRRPVQKRNKREVGCYVFGVLNGASERTGDSEEER